MKKLEDLKQDLIDGRLRKLYVFYGEDYGIRKHYINKIASFFPNKPKYIDNYMAVKLSSSSRSLFGPTKELVVIYDDEEFANLPTKNIQKFINSLKVYTAIFVYEEALEHSNLFKEFDEYVTYFPLVQDNIGKEFVSSELKLNIQETEDLAHNCSNDYNSILLESDKIKEYAHFKGVSEQVAYEALEVKNQLLEKVDTFNVQEFMNDILLNNLGNLAYWYEVIKNEPDKFFSSLTYIFNDFIIAAVIKEHGKWDGGTFAYNCKLPWGRTKIIRQMAIPYQADYLYDCAYKVACIDAEVKSGRLERTKVIDYFFTDVL